MAEFMEEEDITQYKEKYNVQMNELTNSTIEWLCTRLNPLKPLLGPNNNLMQDWRGLAEVFGYDVIEIENLQRVANPCYEVLMRYCHRPLSSVYGLLGALQKIERYDIIADDQFYKKIDEDCLKKSSEIQVPQVSSSLEAVPFKEEVRYTAFVCCHPKDLEFVRVLEKELECKYGFKLFIPERDQEVGQYTLNNLANLIKIRCEKMLVVLSPRFATCSDCMFQISFAMALDITRKERKIIPIIYEACVMPDILSILSKVDYTRTDIRDWFWKRLVESLRPLQSPPPSYSGSIESKDSAISSSLNSSLELNSTCKDSQINCPLTALNKPSELKSSSKSNSLSSSSILSNQSDSSKKTFFNFFSFKKSKDQSK